ncbi:MAG: hypothetical protein OEW42_03890 [Acidimicrobiia bacterium]|nr:hypothetical protein [Acidimicrobiia bacterium]
MMTLSSNESARWGARWLAGIGTALLAVAAVSLASARWEQFGPGARLGILLGASAVAFATTQLLRRVAPETTRALDALVATLVPVDVAALVIVSGGTWRPALLAGGAASMISSETLRRRDPTFIAELGTAIGGVVMMCGFAALYELSAPVLVAGLGLVTVLVAPVGRERWVPIIWAASAGLTPASRVLDDAVFTGMGTMRDLGLLDAAQRWETLTAGALATVALVLAAVLRRRVVVALLAVATAAATGIQVWGELDPPATVALVAVAIVLGAIEIALAVPAVQRVDRAITKAIADLNAVANGMLTLVVAAAAWVYLTEGDAPGAQLQYTAAVVALVWLIGDLRRAAELGQRGLDRYLVGGNWEPALPGFVVAAASAAYLGTDEHLVLGVALAVLGGLAITTLRPGRLVTATVAFTAAPFLTGREPVVTLIVAVVATWGVAYAATRLAGRNDRTLAGFVGSIAVVTVIPGGVAASSWRLGWGGLFGLVLLWAVARSADARVPVLGRTYRLAGQLGLAVLALDDLALAALAAAVVAVIHELEFRERGEAYHRLLAASSAMLAWWFALGAAEVELVDLYVLPPLWLLSAGMIRIGLDRSAAVLVAAPLTMFVTVTGRIDDGRAVHTVLLGAVALAVAGWAALRGERALLVIGGSVAVAVAAYEGLAQSVGVETWGWLVIGGTAAITAAGLLEVRAPSGGMVEDGTAGDDAFVS